MSLSSRSLRRSSGLRTAVGALFCSLALVPLACSESVDTSSTAGGGGNGGLGGGDSTLFTSSSSMPTSSGSTAQGGGGAGAGSTTSSTGSGGSGGTMSNCPPDEDGDGLSDEIEGKATGRDTDSDGTLDYQDLDSDNDTLPDAYEGQTEFLGCQTPQDSDSDGTPDYIDTDSDGNGLPDKLEIYPDGSAYDPQKPAPNPADTNGDGTPDYADDDNDGDNLLDTVELKAGVAVDTDADGVPDLDDLDSDKDTISDQFEGQADPDGDGIAAFRDSDSDGDGLTDFCEAGQPHPINTPPFDHDSDGKFDYLDLDSDNDGIVDAVEDADQNCLLGDGETDPFAADTDSDGANDLAETLLGSDPQNVLNTPAHLNKYFFILPHNGDPAPLTNRVPMQTNLNQGDVAFIVDTTATMGGGLQNLKAGLMDIVSALKNPMQAVKIPDLAVGFAGHDDFAYENYGAPGDLPFYISGPTGYLSTSLNDNFTSVFQLNVHDGGDLPESQIAAYTRALNDKFLIWPSGSMPPAGAPGGTYGSLHFRKGSLPIVVGITDAPFHNGRRSNAPDVLHDTYSFNGAPNDPFATPTMDNLVTEMNKVGARFIGMSLKGGSREGADPYEDMAYLTDRVASNVPTSAFGGQLCKTTIGGAFIPADGPPTPEYPGGTCRLIFDVQPDGTGLSTSIVGGVQALLKSIKVDIRILAVPELPEPVGGTSVEMFIQSITVEPSGGNDPAEVGVPCITLALAQFADKWQFPEGLLPGQDAVNESALGVTPTQKVCFNVVPKPNSTLPQKAGVAQVFTALLTIKAKNGNAFTELALGVPRQIIFIIPPAPQ